MRLKSAGNLQSDFDERFQIYSSDLAPVTTSQRKFYLTREPAGETRNHAGRYQSHQRALALAVATRDARDS
jgi:hypothetical protein